jgi:adenine-specific DNA-methyltransferase
MENKYNENLGQVFTSVNIAKLMIKLLRENLETGVILDPGVGQNIFFQHLLDEAYTKVGVDVDGGLLSEINNLARSNYLLMNFFDLNKTNKFDGIIMNPPYIRQEELIDSKYNNKKKIIATLKEYSEYLDKRHNLYVYFFLKAHQLLSNGGVLIAICYDSWLYTKYGEKFIKFLEDKFNIRRVIHFEKKAFENAEIGATILELVKDDKLTNHIRYEKYHLSDDYGKKEPIIDVDIDSISKIPKTLFISFPKSMFIPLDKLVSDAIKRGIDPLLTKHFIFEYPEFNETIPLIKQVKKIRDYTVNEKNVDYLIYHNEGLMSNKLSNYLDKVKKQVMNSNKNISLRKRILKEEKWYKIRLVKPGKIIFNYYLRGRIRFLYNPSLYYVSHNFYTFNTIHNEFLMLSLLNSTFTKLAVLSCARNQGNGLKKIQLYEFFTVPIFDQSLLRKKDRTELINLGQSLSISDNASVINIIQRIDELLLHYYNAEVGTNISFRELKRLYSNGMNKELNDSVMV